MMGGWEEEEGRKGFYLGLRWEERKRESRGKEKRTAKKFTKFIVSFYFHFRSFSSHLISFGLGHSEGRNNQ